MAEVVPGQLNILNSDRSLIGRATEIVAPGARVTNGVLELLGPSVDVRSFGIVGDGCEVWDGETTAASDVLESASAEFTAADVGKVFFVGNDGGGPGVPGTTIFGDSLPGLAIYGTFTEYLSPTQMRMSVAATLSLTGQRVVWGTDDTQAFVRLNAEMRRLGGVSVYLQPSPISETGRRSGIYFSKAEVWLRGVRSFRVYGNGAALMNCVLPTDVLWYESQALLIGDSTLLNRGYGYPPTPGSTPVSACRIDTVAAGSSSVTLKTLADASKFWRGQWVRVHGYDIQGSGFPPNLRYFELRKVVGVNAATGVIQLDSPLDNSYDEDWYEPPAYASEPYAPVGPAAIMPIDRPGENGFTFTEYGYAEHFELLTNPAWPLFTYPGGRQVNTSSMLSVGGVRTFRGVGLKAQQLTVGDGHDYTFEGCDFETCEPDKLLGNLTFLGSRVTNGLEGGTSVNRLTLDRGYYKCPLALWSPNVTVMNSVIDLTSDASCSATSGYWASISAHLDNNLFILPAADYQSEVLSLPDKVTCTVVTVPSSSSFTVDEGDGTFRINAGRGTVLHAGDKTFAIDNITHDAINARFIVTGKASEPISPGDVFTFAILQNLTITASNRFSEFGLEKRFYDLPTLNRYVECLRNERDAPAGRHHVFDLDFAWHSGYMNFHVDKPVTKIEVVITRAKSGAGTLTIVDAYPSGGFANLSIDVTQVGVRTILPGSTSGAVGSDVLNPLATIPPTVKTIQLTGTAAGSGAGDYRGYVIIHAEESVQGGAVFVPPPFTPADIAGLVLWLDASAIPGLSDGDPVGTWADSSGGGNDATQATAGNKPLYKTNILNGQPVVRFDGTDDAMTAGAGATISGADSRTFFVVYKTNVASDANGVVGVFDGSAGGFFGVRGVSVDYASSLISLASSTAFKVVAALYNGTQVKVWEDGAAITPVTVTYATNNHPYRIGNDRGFQFLNGDIAEILVYDSALSDADRGDVEDYLGAKYGITIS